MLLQEVVLVNPKVIQSNKTTDTYEELCLSFPGVNGDVHVRHAGALLCTEVCACF